MSITGLICLAALVLSALLALVVELVIGWYIQRHAPLAVEDEQHGFRIVQEADYQFARIRCGCGRTVIVARGDRSRAVTCVCGVGLYTARDISGNETPVMIGEGSSKRKPTIVGWQ